MTLWLAAYLAVATISCVAADLSQQIDPAEVNIGDQAIVAITITNGNVGDVQLPAVDGLQVVGSRSFSNLIFSNGTLSRSMIFKFAVVASRSGSFIIPAFDIHTAEGEVLHVKAMKLLAYDNSTAPTVTNAPAAASPSPSPDPNAAANPSFNPNGPVVQPPSNPVTTTAPSNNANSSNDADSSPSVPRDADGGPAKVFILITPDSTDAYVGQSIPMRIDFLIRMEVAADQNSLPTIKGSDFLMNAFMTRGHMRTLMLENQQYLCETWITAISAPKSGDFPLSMERDTYWVKSITSNNFDPFGGMFSRHADLAHEMVSSNALVMHVRALPDEGRPAHFTGVIGQFQVTGSAHPPSVDIGEPVTLDFSVAGEGNFDYVRCPALPDDPAWKAYVPSSKTDYRNEAHTNGVKTFEQSIIPNKNGDLPLPPASFSYFDPSLKQYVTIPISLPTITVTGSIAPLASTAPIGESDSAAIAATPKAEFLPNRFEIGTPRMSLAPVYRQAWFWATQGGLLVLPLLGGLLFFIRARVVPDTDRAERMQRQLSLHQEEDAMAEAVRRNDSLAFFIAARHAIQLQLGAQWHVSPEALTLGEIRTCDAHLAKTLEPLFTQADAVIYSGQTQTDLNLAEWDARVRTELLQPLPA